ncbi:MAG: DUF1836 domain-containing protein [Defluviitaleaceae bacterium]|nr:DUF1836 domain-containing protein [Defluviitaleaceae bacterium]
MNNSDPLSDIRHYSPTMTISQVLKFCEKKGVQITRAMIQNYIRAGILPPPINKRLYTHKHLAALVTIDRLKAVFEIPHIRAELEPFLDEEGLPLEIYFELNKNAQNLTADIKTADALQIMACAAELKRSLV